MSTQEIATANSSAKYNGTALHGNYNGTEVDQSNTASDPYQEDSDEAIELVKSYEALPSTVDTVSMEDVVVPDDSIDHASSYELVETYEPASSSNDPAPSTAEPETESPASATPAAETPTSSSSSPVIFLIFSIVAIAALYAIHHFCPDLSANLRERLSRTSPSLATYLPRSKYRARKPDAEEGDELESKGLMGQYNIQPEHGEKEAEAEDEDGDGGEGLSRRMH